MHYSELSLENTLAIWWSMIWRMFLVSILVGAALGFIAGVIVTSSGSPELSSSVGALVGWLASIPVSIWALKAALSKKYGGYIVAMVKPHYEDDYSERASDCELLLHSNGYKVRAKGAGWIITEPLGGRQYIRSLGELEEYAKSKGKP